jgi:hypothetical protein
MKTDSIFINTEYYECLGTDHLNQRARTIDDNHLEMVKFRGKDDRAYEMVKEDIRELIERSPLARDVIGVKSGWMVELSTQDVAKGSYCAN